MNAAAGQRRKDEWWTTHPSICGKPHAEGKDSVLVVERGVKGFLRDPNCLYK
jgi:hypothetical protein